MPVGNNTKKIILGIDPGIADTGFGVISVEGSTIKSIAYGSIKTEKNTPFPERLEKLEKELAEIIIKYQPDKSGVEELFFCNNAKTAFSVGQARGVILLTLRKHRIPISEFTPLQVKQGITGYGKAEKRQIQLMVKNILNLAEIPKPDDAADALAIAVCAANNNPFEQI